MLWILREPLIYFVLLGAGLFWLNASVAARDAQTIVVDDAALLEFIRQRSRDYSAGNAEARWADASALERESLVKDYVREEALYREAISLGYQESDYVIKRRLVQKLELFLSGLASGVERSREPPSDADVAQYYADNATAYSRPAAYSFVHVFFADQAAVGAASPPADVAARRAHQTFVQLSQNDSGDIQVSRLGDRFPYHAQYAQRSAEFLKGHFGTDFVTQLAALRADNERWQGPLRSKYGVHLVRLTSKESGGVPELADIREPVVADMRLAQQRRRTEEAIAGIVGRYAVQQQVTVSE